MKKLFLVFAVFLMSVLGCKMPGSNSTNENNSSSIKEQPAKTSNLKEELQNAFKKFRNVPFATVKGERTGDNPETITEQYSSANSSYSRKSDNEENTQVIIVGPEKFSKMNSSWPWRKESDSNEPASEAFFSRYNYLAEKIPSFEIQPGAEETVNGKKAAVYSLTLAKPNPDIPSLIKIWIGKDSGLPLKMLNEFGNNNKFTETFDFETTVSIERPAIDKK